MTPPIVTIGGFVKVFLPGESPWTEVIILTADGFMGRIDNKLLNEYSEFEQASFSKTNFGTVSLLPILHTYKRNDVVEFAWEDEQGIFTPKKEEEV